MQSHECRLSVDRTELVSQLNNNRVKIDHNHLALRPFLILLRSASFRPFNAHQLKYTWLFSGEVWKTTGTISNTWLHHWKFPFGNWPFVNRIGNNHTKSANCQQKHTSTSRLHQAKDYLSAMQVSIKRPCRTASNVNFMRNFPSKQRFWRKNNIDEWRYERFVSSFPWFD